MLDFLHSIFPSLNLDPRKPKASQFVHRNDLKASTLKVKKRLVNIESTPLLQNDEIENNFNGCNYEMKEKCGATMKFVMRKETAARLLSKCKNGGIVQLKDVAQDLRKIPGNAVRLVSFNAKDE